MSGEQLPKCMVLTEEEEDKYNPTKVTEMMNAIRRERESKLEGKQEDRQVKIFNGNGDQQLIKSLLMKID
jgi:hypothetical protein